MPNWTTNAIAMRTEALPRLVNAKGDVDFNLVRPMPASLGIEAGSFQDRAVEAASAPGASVDDDTPCEARYMMGDVVHEVRTHGELVAAGRIYLENERLYGAQTWYDWCPEHWGTKWNACDSHVQEFADLSVVTFDTAWSPVDATLLGEALGEVGRDWYGEWFDEDYSGIYTYSPTPLSNEMAIPAELGIYMPVPEDTGLLLESAYEEDEYGGYEYGDFRDEYDLDGLRRAVGLPVGRDMASARAPEARDVIESVAGKAAKGTEGAGKSLAGHVGGVRQ